MRTLLVASLLTLPLALPTAAQQLLPAPAPVYRGVYDVATQRLLQPGPGGQAGGADGGGLVEVYDNGADGPGFYYLSPPDGIELDWGSFDAGGLNAILRVDVGYATVLGSVDAVLRLHSGTGPDGKAGKGIAVPLTGLPGSPDGQVIVNVVTVDLGTPWVPADEVNVGYGVHFPATTDAATSGPFIPASLGDAKAKIGRYRLNGDHIADLGSNGNPLHFFMKMYGVAPDFAVGGVVKVLRRKDSLNGLIELEGEVDVARYEGLMGELLDVSVVGGGGLEPTVSVVSLPDETVLATAGGPGETKAKLKGVELTANGSYDIRVAGASEVLLGDGGGGSTGSYTLKLKGKLPPEAKKPAVADTPQAAGGTLSSFHANAGALFNGVVKPGAKGGAPGDAPVLQGPLGPVALGEHLTSKKGVHRIKKLPLPVAGGYVLQAGADDNGQLARVKLREAKTKSGKLGELERALIGEWVADDFVAPERSKRVTLAPSKGGESRIMTVLGQVVPNPNNPFDVDEYVIELQQTLKSWKITAPSPGTRVFSWEVALPVEVSIDGEPTDASGTLIKENESNLVESPDGDTDRVRFLESGEVWNRDVYQGPAAPQLTGLAASDPAEGGEGGVSYAGLRMAGPPEAKAFQIFKGSTSMFVPGPLFAVVPANGAGLDGSTEWVDLASGTGTARYWVRSVAAGGAVSAHSAPIDVSP